MTVTVTRTTGADIPAGHCEVRVIGTGETAFVPIGQIQPQFQYVDNASTEETS
jgi:hypothetical protein